MIPESDGPGKPWPGAPSLDKPWLAKPRIRRVEAIPVVSDGRELLVLRDPARIAAGDLALSMAAGAVLHLMDGVNDLRDVQAALFRAYGQMVEMETLKELVRVLDENGFLEGASFDLALAEIMAAPSRPALLAGCTYPADPEELSCVLDGYFSRPAGPGSSEPPENLGWPIGLIAPHIDYARGGPCYAWTYRQLDPEDPPDLAVILGTAHFPIPAPLAVGGKDFETPFGPLRCETNLAAELSARLGLDRTEDEMFMRMEHSVELQAVWLAYRFRKSPGPKILPLLCGSFYPLVEQGLTPEDDPRYEESLAILGEFIREWSLSKGRVTILASVDLSHVGSQFEDAFEVDDRVREAVRAGDLSLLEKTAAGDWRGVYEQVLRNRDRTHICGLAPIYTMSRLLEGLRPAGECAGRLLSYDQWNDREGRGLVSFAALRFP